METLKLRIDHQAPEPSAEPPPTGWVWIERADQRAVLLTPEEIEAERCYPLLTVLHGAGRREELLIKAYRDEPERRQALFLIPRSRQPTWDLIAEGVRGSAWRAPDEGADASTPSRRPDLDFLEYAYDLVYRRYPIDPQRQGLIGYSDGASYALSIGLANPALFRAVMGWAAGFLAMDPTAIPEDEPRPAILLEYGTHDPLFPFERVALPMRDQLQRMGYAVTFRVDEGGRHWPSGDFQPEALDWFFSEPWQTRA